MFPLANGSTRKRPIASSATGRTGMAVETRASPGKAPDLRKTILQREHLIEVISCGRPGTEMPHFDKSAYEETNCYGLTIAQVGKDMPAHPHSNSLTQREIAAVVDYVLKVFVRK